MTPPDFDELIGGTFALDAQMPDRLAALSDDSDD